MTRRNKNSKFIMAFISLLVACVIGIFSIDRVFNRKEIEDINVDVKKLLIKKIESNLCDPTFFLKNNEKVDKSLYTMIPQCIPLKDAATINVSIKYKNVIQGFTVVISE